MPRPPPSPNIAVSMANLKVRTNFRELEWFTVCAGDHWYVPEWGPRHDRPDHHQLWDLHHYAPKFTTSLKTVVNNWPDSPHHFISHVHIQKFMQLSQSFSVRIPTTTRQLCFLFVYSWHFKVLNSSLKRLTDLDFRIQWISCPRLEWSFL